MLKKWEKLFLSHFLKDENDIFDKTHFNNIGTQMIKKYYWYKQM